MPTSLIILASLGGLIACASTTIGSLLSYYFAQKQNLIRLKFSADFAMGLMLSAVAFTLVGPVAADSIQKPGLLLMGAISFGVGVLLILLVRYVVERQTSIKNRDSVGPMVLALALLIHNFPEGLASGAAMSGLSWSGALPLLAAISLQNIPEGGIMVLCLLGLGWSKRAALGGGLASGLVELAGGVVSGVAVAQISDAIPLIFMAAGGAMFISIVTEVKGRWLHLARKPEFAVGLLAIPLLNLILI